MFIPVLSFKTAAGTGLTNVVSSRFDFHSSGATTEDLSCIFFERTAAAVTGNYAAAALMVT